MFPESIVCHTATAPIRRKLHTTLVRSELRIQRNSTESEGHRWGAYVLIIKKEHTARRAPQLCVRGVYICWHRCAGRERDKISPSFVCSSLIDSPSLPFLSSLSLAKMQMLNVHHWIQDILIGSRVSSSVGIVIKHWSRYIRNNQLSESRPIESRTKYSEGPILLARLVEIKSSFVHS